MTHYYELYKRVSRSRRRELASFIHEMKKLMGGKYHLHVVEVLEDCDEDYIFVDEVADDMDYEVIKSEVLALVDKYGIARRNVDFYDNQPEEITIHLYSDF